MSPELKAIWCYSHHLIWVSLRCCSSWWSSSLKFYHKGSVLLFQKCDWGSRYYVVIYHNEQFHMVIYHNETLCSKHYYIFYQLNFIITWLQFQLLESFFVKIDEFFGTKSISGQYYFPNIFHVHVKPLQTYHVLIPSLLNCITFENKNKSAIR